MKKITLIILLLLGTFSTVNAQSLSKNDVVGLNAIIEKFLIDRDSAHVLRRPEIVIISIETDSSGKINKIHLLGDEKNKDSTLGILSRLTPAEFSRWKVVTCLNKTIIIPLYSSGSGDYPIESDYADRIFRDMFWEIQRPVQVIKERGRSIVVSPIIYSPPGKGISDYPAKGFSTPGKN